MLVPSGSTLAVAHTLLYGLKGTRHVALLKLLACMTQLRESYLGRRADDNTCGTEGAAHLAADLRGHAQGGSQAPASSHITIS